MIQHNDSVRKPSVIMLNVANKPFMLSVIMLSVIMLTDIMLSDIMLSIVMLSIVAPLPN